MPAPKRPPTGGEPPVPPPESELAPRKLIRPSFSEIRRDQGISRGPGRKSAPPEQTNAEAFYYQKQMQAKTPMVVLLLDGEELRGWIEWYDRDVIKLNRDNAPNLLLQKRAIKYLYKEEEERMHRRRRFREERRAGQASPAEGSEE